ncbi:MAG: hypothetical protein E7445_09955 [Ruminococcaceae bacterium]|nr:hypothetical protein [Oscillospiraceae bacterium]
MQLGLTWPLQRLLRVSVPYGDPIEHGLCWDAHCITLHGRSSLLLVHCASRYTCVRYDLSPMDWNRLSELVLDEIKQGLLEAGIPEEQVRAYLQEAGEIQLTRTHGRREVAFLNRAWEDVLSADLLVDQSSHRQPILNYTVNDRLCRCAGEDGMDTAHAHFMRYFQEREQTR